MEHSILTDVELEWVVSSNEVAEQLLERFRFSEASAVLQALLDMSESDVLAHLKLAYALLAADVADLGSADSGAGVSRTFNPTQFVSTARRLRVPQLLHHAIQLEPLNAHVHENADLLLRVISNEDIPDRMWTAEVPRSPGMDSCLLVMLRQRR